MSKLSEKDKLEKTEVEKGIDCPIEVFIATALAVYDKNKFKYMNKELLEKIDNMIERLAIIELHTGKSEDILIDKNTLLDIKKELEHLKYMEESMEEFTELKEIFMKMVVEYRLFPYKTYDKKNPAYYLMKPEEYQNVPVKIPKWLYDYINKGTKKEK